MTKRVIVAGVALSAVVMLLLIAGLTHLRPLTTKINLANSSQKPSLGQGAQATDPQAQAALERANSLLQQTYPEAYRTLEETAAREGRASMLEALEQLDQTVSAIDQEALEATQPLLNRVRADQRIRPADYGRSLTAALEQIRATPINLDDPAVLQSAARAYHDHAIKLVTIVPPPGYEELHRFWVATTAGKAYVFGALAVGPTLERRFVILRLLNEIVEAETKAVEALTRTVSS